MIKDFEMCRVSWLEEDPFKNMRKVKDDPIKHCCSFYPGNEAQLYSTANWSLLTEHSAGNN